MKYIETEQKFKYNYIPYDELKYKYKTVVTKKYISTDPLVSITHNLLQNGQNRYFLTLKQKAFLTRKNCRIMMNQESFEELFNYLETEPIIIDVYEFEFDDTHTIIFKKIKGLDMDFGEIEYKDKEDYEKISPIVASMPFFSQDVTYDENYYVKNIWKKINNIK